MSLGLPAGSPSTGSPSTGSPNTGNRSSGSPSTDNPSADSARGDLPASVRARSVLLSTHQLRVEDFARIPATGAGSIPPALSPYAPVCGFVAVGPTPYLVSSVWETVRPGPVLAAVVGADQRVGQLFLAGELGEPVRPEEEPGVAEVIDEHRECMVAPIREHAELYDLRVARLTVHGVWLRAPGGGTDAPRSVDLVEYERVEADPWAAFASEVIRHLDLDHHADLLEVARGAGAANCSAVTLSRLEPGGAILTAMSSNGVVNIVIPFDPPAATPREAGHRLTGFIR